MLKKLKHANHGTHFTYTDTEYNKCLKNGWVDFEEDEPPKKSQASEDREGIKSLSSINVSTTTQKRKRGRPSLKDKL